MFILRGTGVLLAVGSAFFVISLAVALFASAFPPTGSRPLMILARIGGLALVGSIFALFAKAGFDMFRNVDATAVENFAFIFAALSARVFYSTSHWALNEWPLHFSEGHSLRFSLPASHPSEILYLIAFLSFFLFRRVYISALMSILELNPKNPPDSSSFGNDSSIPEFPEKSPLIELR